MLQKASLVVFINERQIKEVFYEKITSAVIVVLMVICSAVPAYAIETKNISSNGIMSPQFTAILAMSEGLSIDSFGLATCEGSVTPSSNSYRADLTVFLQKSTGSGWSTIQSWFDSGVGYVGVTINEYYYVVRGTYRVGVTANVYNSSGTWLETETFYSAVRMY